VVFLACTAWLASGCVAETDADLGLGGSPGGSFSLEVEISDLVPTVATVTWTLAVEEVEGAFVRYQSDDGVPRFVTVVPDGDSFSCALVGLKPADQYAVMAAVDTPVGRFESATETFETGPLPTTLPGDDFTFEETAEGHDGFLVTTVNSVDATALILDGQGDIVWWYTESDAYSPRAVLSHDRQSVIVLLGSDMEAPMGTELMTLTRVNMAGTVEDSFEVPGLHHDFTELPDGTLAYIATDSRVVDGLSIPILGDRIVEMSADGDAVRDVWSAWDDFEFDPHKVIDLVEPGQTNVDWTHANALDYYPDIDAYGLSLYHFGVIALIDRQTGDLLWQVGRTGSDIALSTPVDFGQSGPQHQFDLVGDSLLVFNNGSPDDYASVAVEYALDLGALTAEAARVHSSDPPIFCTVWGDASYLPGGNWLVTWSTAGRLEEITPEGDVVSRVGLPMGEIFGYTTFVQELVASPEP